MPDVSDSEDVDVMKPDDRENVLHWEIISVDSAKKIPQVQSTRILPSLSCSLYVET